MDLSVVIPVKDEAANVASLVAEVRAALDGLLDYEILCVDDGSEDGTATEVGRALEVAGHHDITVGRDGDAGAGILRRAADELCPLAGARGPTEPCDEGVMAAGSGGHDAAAKVQTTADLARHDDVSVGHRRESLKKRTCRRSLFRWR